MVVHKLAELSANCLHVRILFYPSAFVPECPEPPLVFSAALWTASALIFLYLIWWILLGWEEKRTSSVEGADLGCICFHNFKVVSVRVIIPFCMLLVISLIALAIVTICICPTNFYQRCPVVLGPLTCLRLLCIVSPSFSSSVRYLLVYNWSLLLRVLVWSLVFESLLGFFSKRLGMMITAFNAIFFNGESLTHASMNLVVWSIKHLPHPPVGKRKIFFFQ